MNTKDACVILETLMDGINPITGELLPEDHVCQEPEVLRALHKALMALCSMDEAAAVPETSPSMVNRNGRLNAGRPWTTQDLDKLKHLYEAGTDMEEICRVLQRRRRGVERQLAGLGLMEAHHHPADPDKKHAKAGLPWTAADDQALQQMWAQGQPKAQIAKMLQRSSWAVECRLERMGLLNEQDRSR